MISASGHRQPMIMPEDFPIPPECCFSKSSVIGIIENFKKKYSPYTSSGCTTRTLHLVSRLPDDICFGYGIGSLGHHNGFNAFRYLTDFSFTDVNVFVEKLTHLSKLNQVILMLHESTRTENSIVGKELMLYDNSPYAGQSMRSSIVLKDMKRVLRERSLISIGV